MYQQKLQAWEPFLTPTTVLPAFLILGILCIPIGITLWIMSDDIKDFSYDYTYCLRNNGSTGVCRIRFELREDFDDDVYLYYVLNNYHQNARRYLNSFEKKQVKGELRDGVTSDCEPFDKNKFGRTIVPCGAIANSMFNDTFEMFYLNKKYQIKEDIMINRKKISWKTDRTDKWRNPPELSRFDDFEKPPNWPHAANQFDPSDPENNGLKHEPFMVWMRVGAFPTVTKLYGRLFRTGKHGQLTKGLPKGTYLIKINYSELLI